MRPATPRPRRKESYAVGLATNLERLVAQDELLRTELQLASAQFDRAVFYLNLVRALGSLRDHIADGRAGRG